jgi:hypothetical protein
LLHSNGEAEQFYRDLKLQGVSVRVGIEASGHDRWFHRLLAELNFDLWVGDAAQIKAMRVRKQKTDRRDAQHLLKLLVEDRGNALLRFLLEEAAQGAIQSHPEWRRRYLHLAMRRQRSIAKVAMARRLAVALFWMWRNQQNYQQACEFGSHSGQPVSRRGVK